jgi:peroxiredoxin
MPSNLTGEFDVVAEFSLDAANRVLAAMHRVERFPHSISARVDDNPLPGEKVPRPVFVGAVDSFGDTVVNHEQIGKPNPFPGQLAATDPAHSLLGQILNPDVVGATVGPIIPSHLQGLVQLQFSPPELEIDDRSGTNLTVREHLRCRYFPDRQTTPLAEFIRGDLAITAPVSQIASQSTTVKAIDVNIKADQVTIGFTPANVSLSPEDLAAINLAIRNAMITSFLPSNFPLPDNINFMSFKTMFGPPGALLAMINMGPAAGNPNSFNNPFIRPADDFAFGVGRDYVLAAFNSVTQSILNQPFPPVTFPVDLWLTTLHVTANITLSSVTADLQEGNIVLTIQGNATTNKWWLRQFGFTVTQLFTLRLLGSSADLDVGDLSMTTTSTLANLFIDNAKGAMQTARDQALAQSNAQGIVYQNLDSQAYLGGFLSSLLTPARPSIRPQPQGFQLTYTSYEIHPSGIILHGAVSVRDWPPAHVEFQEIPATVHQFQLEHDYTALNSWIPGGWIQRFDWSSQGQPQPFHTDEDKFVLFEPPASIQDGNPSTSPVTGFVPLCLTLRGTRLSSSGAEVAQPVVATACGVTQFPIVGGTVATDNGTDPVIAIAQAGPQGQAIVTGHASARLAGSGASPPNRIVYFADDKTSGSLDFLARALVQSKRGDATTAILGVLTADQLSKTRYTPGVVYADNQNGAWERVFGVKTSKRPLTLIVNPSGKIVWQQEGEVDTATLAAALAKGLVRGAAVKVQTLRLTLRLGNPPPNFLFEYAPGRQLTLAKAAGRPVTLVFWNSASQPSIEAVRDLQGTAGPTKRTAPLVLAINDGEPADVAKKVAAANRLTAIIVTDPKREISFAYGVTVWPTVVSIDAQGLVSDIRYGRQAGQQVEPPSTGKTAASR